MKQQILSCKRAYEDPSRNEPWRYMYAYSVRRYTEPKKEKPAPMISMAQLACGIRSYCVGAVGMTQERVLNDSITSAETVARMMPGSMPENLQKIFFS